MATMKEPQTELSEKNQTLGKKFGFWSVIGILICCSGAWEGLIASLAQSLLGGSSVALLWGWVVVSFGMLFLSASLAEMASLWPTAGGQYHWVYELGPPRMKNILSWFTCCWTIAALLLGEISCAMGFAVQTQAYVQIAYPNYIPERWHAYLITVLETFIFMIVNIFWVRSLRLVNVGIVVLHVLGFFIVIIVLLACTKEKNSAKFVFTDFVNSTGWENDGVSWSVGLLTSVFAFFSLDAASHYAEEVENPTVVIPRAMIIQVVANAVMTFPFIIVLLFCIGDVGTLLGSPIAFTSPFTQIMYNSTGNIGVSIFLSAIPSAVAFAAAVDLYGAAARLLWTLARDQALPPWLGMVNTRLDVPLNALLVCSVPALIIPMIYIWNSTAFYGIMAGVLVFFQLSYFVPVLLNIVYGRWHNQHVKPAWSLGRYGLVVNVLACGFSLYIIIFMSLPVYMPVTAINMNYACAMVGGFTLFSAILWFVYVRARYNGPIYNTATRHLIEGRVSDETGSDIAVDKEVTTGETQEVKS